MFNYTMTFRGSDDRMPAGNYLSTAKEKANELATATGRVVILYDDMRQDVAIFTAVPGPNVESSEPTTHHGFEITGNVGVFEKTMHASCQSQAYTDAATLIRSGAKLVTISHNGSYRTYSSAKELDKLAAIAAREEAEAERNTAIGGAVILGGTLLFALGKAIHDKIKKE